MILRNVVFNSAWLSCKTQKQSLIFATDHLKEGAFIKRVVILVNIGSCAEYESLDGEVAQSAKYLCGYLRGSPKKGWQDGVQWMFGLQRDLDKLQSWAVTNHMMVNKSRFQILHLQRGNPGYLYRLSCWRAAPLKEIWGLVCQHVKREKRSGGLSQEPGSVHGNEVDLKSSQSASPWLRYSCYSVAAKSETGPHNLSEAGTGTMNRGVGKVL